MKVVGFRWAKTGEIWAEVQMDDGWVETVEVTEEAVYDLEDFFEIVKEWVYWEECCENAGDWCNP